MRVTKSTQPPKAPKAKADLPDPKLPKGKDFNGKSFDGLHYDRAGGDVFVGGIEADDVGQGNLGDCFFLSSLASVARTHPDLLRRAIQENADGTFTVTFKQKGGKPDVKVTVDADFPSLPGRRQTFARGLDRNSRGRELWPAVFEKAYAKWQGGYQKLNGGGFADQALPALTGKRASWSDLADLSAEKLWTRISSATTAGKPMVTGTPSAADLKKRTGRADMAGLLDGHAYALLGCSERGGKRFVEVYSPLSPAEGGNPAGGSKRTVELPFEDYRRFFGDLVIGEVP